MFDFDVILIPALFVAAAIAGRILMALARRGRRTFPSCPACGYNIIGVVGSSRHCPECGAWIARGRFNTWGHLPRAHRLLHRAGLFIMLIGIIGLLFLSVIVGTLLLANR